MDSDLSSTVKEWVRIQAHMLNFITSNIFHFMLSVTVHVTLSGVFFCNILSIDR